MLDDRPYMRSSRFEAGLSATAILMIANAGIFVFQSILQFYFSSAFAAYWKFFALSTDGLTSGFVWQVITFQFMHAPLDAGGVWHLLGNLLALYFFGHAVEESLGKNRYVKFYLTAGLIGGLLQMAFAFAIPKYFDAPMGVVGASAGVLGLVAVFATMFPERVLTLLLFFVIPVSIRARTLLWVALGLSIFGILIPLGRMADAAHLGGILTGMAFVRWFVHGNGWPIGWPRFRSSLRRRRELVSAAVPKGPFWTKSRKAVQEDDLPPAEFISREVDPILDKISAHGIQSLTERERKILEAARAKMAKR